MTNSWLTPGRILLIGLGGLTLFYLLAPSLVVVPMGFSSSSSLQFPPPHFSLRWYEKMFTDPNWSRGLIASLEAALLTAALATVLGTAAAFSLIRGQFPGKSVVNAMILSPLIVPAVISAIGMYSVYLTGWRVGGFSLGWSIAGTLPGVVVAHTVLALPFVVVNVAASLRTIDPNLELAAMSLGARPWQAFRRIVLPLVLPGVLAGALFAFIISWDEVVVAIFLTSPFFRTLPVEMWQQVFTQVDPTVAAVSTVLLTVTTLLFLFSLLLRRESRSVQDR